MSPDSTAGGTINWCLKIHAVIANQCAHWCGNPPDEWNQVTITTKIAVFSRPVGQLSIHFPSNRGIATPACTLARNDSISLQTPISLRVENSKGADESPLPWGYAVREALIKSARADSERFCFLRKFGKSRNTVCIPDFPNCTEGAKDSLLSRRRFIQRFLSPGSPSDGRSRRGWARRP